MPRVITVTPDSAKIRALREEAGVTQTEMARRIRIHRKTLSRIECGSETAISKTMAGRIAKGLRTDPASIVIEEAA